MKSPWLGRWVLRLTITRDPVGRSIVGDLNEEYETRWSRDGAFSAWRWFTRQALGVGAHQLRRRLIETWNGMRSGGMMQDLKFAWRALRAHPSVHMMVVAVIALGVAGTALAFSMVDSALLRALPYAAPGELYAFHHSSPDAGADDGRVSPMDIEDLKSSLGWETHLSSYVFSPSNSIMTLTGEGAPRAVSYAAVDASFFGVLGVQTAQGRTLGEPDNVPGRDGVAVVSEAFWRDHFGADTRLLGQTMTLDRSLFEVVGIMPASFDFPAGDVDVWVPASLMTEEMVPNRRDVRYRQAILRIIAGGTAAGARASAEGVFARLEAEYPASNEGWNRARLTPLKDELVGTYRTGLLFLMGVTGLLLMVVAASVGGLLTARTSSRTRELAVRLSVGADRVRLARQLLGESLILAAAGGLAGLGLAWLSSGLVSKFTSEALGIVAEVTPDLRVAAFTGIVSLITGLLFGIIPAWGVLRAPPQTFLGGARGGVGGMRRGLRSLVLAETALAAVLLAGTGLMMRSFTSLVETDPGFSAEDVWSLRFNVNFDTSEELAMNRQRLVEIAREVPGVVSVGGSKTPLLQGGGEAYDFLTTDRDGTEVSVTPEAGTFLVLPGFFETLEARFVAGRPFTDDDPRLSVVLNNTLAQTLWPDQDAVGKELRLGTFVLPVMGVIEPLHDDGLTAGSPTAVYVNAVNFPRSSLYMFVRTQTGASETITALQEAIWAEFPDQAILETTRVSEILNTATARPRWLSRVIGGFGFLALTLAAIGVFGVVSQGVQARRGEIAVKIALGAGPQRVLGEQLRTGVGIIAIGTTVGLVAALGLGQTIGTLLYGIEPTDPTSFVLAGVAVLTFGFLASLLPALRATRIDPVHIIREE